MPNARPVITPYLYYEDVGQALTWLAAAFGLEERSRVAAPDGTVHHAEMSYLGGWVYMGHPGPDYQSPRRADHSTGSLYVVVEGLQAHYERAKAAGAKIVEEPADQDYGDRRYGAEDLEGRVWYFAEPVADA